MPVTIDLVKQAEAANDQQKFMIWVVSTLSALSTQVESIVGNGQPGKLHALESRIDAVIKDVDVRVKGVEIDHDDRLRALERFCWMLLGGLILSATAIGWLVHLAK